jgi:hypothetical protein
MSLVMIYVLSDDQPHELHKLDSRLQPLEGR